MTVRKNGSSWPSSGETTVKALWWSRRLVASTSARSQGSGGVAAAGRPAWRRAGLAVAAAAAPLRRCRQTSGLAPPDDSCRFHPEAAYLCPHRRALTAAATDPHQKLHQTSPPYR